MFNALIASILLAAIPAVAFDATETLSDFTIDGDIQQTPSQILIRNGVIKYTSSKRGAVTEPLRLHYSNPSNGAVAVCLTFGATKLVDYSGYRGEETMDKVLVVDTVKGKPEFNWASSIDAFVVDEILCAR